MHENSAWLTDRPFMATFNKAIRDNLHFFLIEANQQLSLVELYFRHPDQRVAERLLSRNGYSENLRSRIQNGITRQLITSKRTVTQVSLKACDVMVVELNTLLHLGCQAVQETHGLSARLLTYFPRKDCARLVKEIRTALKAVEPALLEQDSKQAISIGKLGRSLQKRLKRTVHKSVEALLKSKEDDAVGALFATYALRQMLDQLEKVAEHILTANLGQKMSISRYQSLAQVAAGLDTQTEAIRIETVAETRSGSAIAGVSLKASKAPGYLAIFKEGEKKKLKEERQGVESWHGIYPGLAPKILSYHKRGDSASLLIEHLPGHTFESLLVHEQGEVLDAALNQLLKTLKSIWNETELAEPVSAGFVGQLKSRLGSVYSVHPEFKTLDAQICGMRQPSFDQLLDKVAAREKQWQAPFSVYIHGDFNVDNIIFDPLENRIYFIDLHRSCYMDYVQDISVFMVSIYRLQILDTEKRQRMMQVAKSFIKSARNYAQRRGDRTFDLRLALGLVRSFASSTRFILDQSLSRRMYLRSRYLLERLLEVKPSKEDKFRIPLEDLFIE